MKTYTVTRTSHHNNSVTEYTGTMKYLMQCFSYTLQRGAGYSDEKGNSKINRNPKTVKSLISALNRAANNSAANGYPDVSYALREV